MNAPSDRITIAVDVMGGDYGLPITLPAAIACLKQFPDLHLLLVGRSDLIDAALAKYSGYDTARLHKHAASEIIAMDESPAVALRSKKDASMRVAIDLVKQGTAQACVSAGNTGALMAISRFVLKTLHGIDRPAIIATLPTVKGHVQVLDLGANVDCTPEQLQQFGVMASILVSATENKNAPSIALLNIGEEEIKGNETVKRAAELLRACEVNYIGYVEGNEIYTGKADVVVCDGFVGNVALKTSEGVAAMVSHFMKQEFKRSTWTRLIGLLSMPILRRFRRRVDHRRYNGATLLGLNGVVIKSHGSADEVAFRHALIQAYEEARNQVPRRISDELASMLVARQSA